MNNSIQQLPLRFAPDVLLLSFANDGYLPNGSTILDAGCSVGRHTLYLARQGHTVIGVDRSYDDLAVAEKNKEEIGVRPGRALFVQGHLAHLMFNEPFQAVLLNEVTHQMTAPLSELILKNVQRHTESRGFNVISGYLLTENVLNQRNRARAFKPGQLLQIYRDLGWSILSYDETSDLPTHVGSDQPRELLNAKARLIAQKP